MINDRFATRFSDLQSELDDMPFEPSGFGGRYVQSGIWRKWATSAEWEKFEKPDVSGLIGFVEHFLLTHFSRSQ